MNDSGYSKIILAFLAGAAAGAVVSLLTAPKSGRELRADLREFGSRIVPVAKRIPTAVRSAYVGASSAAADAFNESMRVDGSASRMS